MLLQEITDTPLHELSQLIKTFPKTWQKLIDKLRGVPGKLQFHGFDVYDHDGSYGPAIDALTHFVNTRVNKKGLQVSGVLPGVDEFPDEIVEYVVDTVNLVAVLYDVEDDCIILGYDAWIDPNDFHRQLEAAFEQHFGEPMDHENDDHNDFADKAEREFNRVGTYGLAVYLKLAGGPRIDNILDMGGGFKQVLPFISDSTLVKL
jgi:hypothetical protein